MTRRRQRNQQEPRPSRDSSGTPPWGRAVPYVAALAVLGLGPIVFSFHTVEVFPFKEMLIGLLVLAGAAAWLFAALRERSIALSFSPLDFGVIAFWCASCVSVAFSEHRALGYPALWQVSVGVLTYFVVSRSVSTRGRLIGALAVVSCASVLVIGYGFLQIFGRDPFNWQTDFGGRPFATLGNPTILASFLVWSFPIAIALIIASTSSGLRALGFVSAISGAACLMLTRGKGALLAFVLEIIVMMALYTVMRIRMSDARQGRSRATLLAIVIAVMAISVVFFPGTLRRFRESWRGSAGVRMVYWTGALRMFASSPATGTGAGTFRALFPSYRTPQFQSVYGAGQDTSHAHSEYLEILAEEGIVGAVGALALLVALAFTWVRVFRHVSDRLDAWMLICLASAATGILADAGASVSSRYVIGAVCLWTTLGLVEAMGIAVGKTPLRRSFTWSIKRSAGTVAIVVILGLAAFSAQRCVLRPYRAELAFRQALLLTFRGDATGARRAYQQAIDLNGADLRFRYQYATLCLQQGEYADAVRLFRELQRHAVDYLHIHFLLGQAYSMLNDWDAASEEYLAALRKGALPENVSPATLINVMARAQGWEGARHAAITVEMAAIYPNDAALQRDAKPLRRLDN